jgi:hypothetical protein
MNTDVTKAGYTNPFSAGTNNFSLYSRAEIGLSYINDDRTFQISGSIGVERNPYYMPMFAPRYGNSINNNPSFK